MHRAKRMKQDTGLTATEFVVLLCIFIVIALILAPMVSEILEEKRKASCQENMMRLGLAFKMYAKESRGEIYPPPQYFTDGTNKSFAMSPMVDTIYPDYIEDVRVLFCPSTQRQSYKNVTDDSGKFVGNIPDYEGGKASLMDQDYIYMAWAVNEVETEKIVPLGREIGRLLGLPADTPMPLNIKYFFPHLSNLIHNNALLEKPDSTLRDLSYARYEFGENESVQLFRFREQVGRFFITDTFGPASNIDWETSMSNPLLIERPYRNGASRHYESGRHVYFNQPIVMRVDKNSNYYVNTRALPFPEEAFAALDRLCEIPADKFPRFDIERMLEGELEHLKRIRDKS